MYYFAQNQIAAVERGLSETFDAMELSPVGAAVWEKYCGVVEVYCVYGGVGLRLCSDGQGEGGFFFSLLCSERRYFLDLAQSLKENKVGMSFSLTLLYHQ